MDALAVWCRRWLGAPPAAELFEAGYLSTVKGLRLADGREVVVKVRPRTSRLGGCAVVHRALWKAGFPCPEPLVDLQPLDGYAATAETLVLAVDEPPPESELAALSAAALARLVELAPDHGSVPSLAPSPSWADWDHTEPGLWPAPEDRDVDLNACQQPQWLDRVAAAVRDHLRGHRGDPVIGHGDWHPENLCWQDSQLITVHDWDSVICQPEPAIAGLAAASFLGIDGPGPLASVEDSAAFLDAYQRARGRRWTSADYAACWAAGLWQRAFDAKTRSLDGDPEQILTRHEAQARLRLAGLNPGLARCSPKLRGSCPADGIATAAAQQASATCSSAADTPAPSLARQDSDKTSHRSSRAGPTIRYTTVRALNLGRLSCLPHHQASGSRPGRPGPAARIVVSAGTSGGRWSRCAWARSCCCWTSRS